MASEWLEKQIDEYCQRTGKSRDEVIKSIDQDAKEISKQIVSELEKNHKGSFGFLEDFKIILIKKI